MKTSTRQTYFLPVIGLVDPEELKPADLVGVNKDSYLILETLPSEYDARVKAMEVDERPTEQYSDIGGLDTQIQELIEAIVLPMTHKERFERLGMLSCASFVFHVWVLHICWSVFLLLENVCQTASFLFIYFYFMLTLCSLPFIG